MIKKDISQVKKICQEERNIEEILRPKTLKEYVGQERIKNALKMIIDSAKKRNEAVDHLLLYGGPGLGKTTLANLIAKELGSKLRVVSGPNLKRPGDLAALLTNLEEKEVLFIDEAHRVDKAAEEILYSAIDSGKIFFTIGKGPASRIASLSLPSFTLVAATTRVSLISAPLRSRFGAVFRFDFYSDQEIEIIIQRSAKILNIEIEPEAVTLIRKASRATPRIANRLLKRCRDYIEVNNKKVIDEKAVKETFSILEIDELGLEKEDKKIIELIVKKFNKGPVGISSLAAALGEDKKTIEEVYEPYLIKLGFIKRTAKGRKATDKAVKWLNNFN